MKASVALFKGSTVSDTEPVQEVPDELFEVAKNVVKNNKAEVLHTSTVFYVVEPSENGPYSEQFELNEWIPVKIYIRDVWCQVTPSISTRRVIEDMKIASIGINKKWIINYISFAGITRFNI